VAVGGREGCTEEFPAGIVVGVEVVVCVIEGLV
jgi:hypothetical protein